MALPVALQLYSVREDASADLQGALEKIKEMGYDGVEFAGLYGHTPEEVKQMCESVGLVPVSAHVKMAEILEQSGIRIPTVGSTNTYAKGTLKDTGEEGVMMMEALLGFGDMVTNVNLPNIGQISNLPLGAVVETNATFTAGGVKPVMAGDIPKNIYALIARIVGEQEMVLEAAVTRNLDLAFEAFANDPLVTINRDDAKILFDEMIENTKSYLTMYNI